MEQHIAPTTNLPDYTLHLPPFASMDMGTPQLFYADQQPAFWGSDNVSLAAEAPDDEIAKLKLRKRNSAAQKRYQAKQKVGGVSDMMLGRHQK